MLQARLLFLILFVLSSVARADVPSDFFDGLQALQANFEQTVLDENGTAIEQSAGVMYMQRPGKFRWEYRQPYEQLIVADGERVWLYDMDLEQITVRRIDDALSSAPLAMLGEDIKLSSAFAITALGQREGIDWYRLTPKQQDKDVNFIRLGFKNGDLRIIEAEDSLRRMTRLEFSQVRRNLPMAAELFNFIPPPGVDVIGDS